MTSSRAALSRLESFDPEWAGAIKEVVEASSAADKALIAELKAQVASIGQERQQHAERSVVDAFDDAIERNPTFKAVLGEGRYEDVRGNADLITKRTLVNKEMTRIAKVYHESGFPVPKVDTLMKRAIASAFPDEFATSAVQADRTQRATKVAARQSQMISAPTHQTAPADKSVKGKDAAGQARSRKNCAKFGAARLTSSQPGKGFYRTMPGYVLNESQITDITVTTLRNFDRPKYNQIAQAQQKYLAYGKLMDEERVTEADGYGIRKRDVMLSLSNNANTTGLFAKDDNNVQTNNPDNKVDWRHQTTGWAIERREVLENSGPSRIVNLIQQRRADCIIGYAALYENMFWSKPADSTDATTMYGVLYWLVYSATTGFNGGNPTGFTAGAGGLDVSGLTRRGTTTRSAVHLRQQAGSHPENADGVPLHRLGVAGRHPRLPPRPWHGLRLLHERGDAVVDGNPRRSAEREPRQRPGEHGRPDDVPPASVGLRPAVKRPFHEQPDLRHQLVVVLGDGRARRRLHAGIATVLAARAATTRKSPTWTAR